MRLRAGEPGVLHRASGVSQTAPCANNPRPMGGSMTPHSAVLAIDMANYFVFEPGTIATAGGADYQRRAQAIVPPLARLLDAARDAGVLVIYTTDAHTLQDSELQKWPPH